MQKQGAFNTAEIGETSQLCQDKGKDSVETRQVVLKVLENIDLPSKNANRNRESYLQMLQKHRQA